MTLAVLLHAAHLAAAQEFHLMPIPSSLTTNDNKVWIDGNFRIGILGNPDPRLFAEASRFVRRLGGKTGIFLYPTANITPRDRDSTATLVLRVGRPGRLGLGEDERYTLRVDAKQVVVDAPTDLGVLHALETLLQLVSADGTGYFFPGVSIRDQPRFAWRGLLLDVALHFEPVEEIERTIDGMAAVKLNVLHLHLCNDQGFRVESKRFPRLQQLASDGQYYTQEQIRGLVRYATQRGIRIVPEFVVPAHTTAILTAYPLYASIQRDYRLQRYFGVYDPVLDPTNDQVYSFLSALFTEMAGLFPDRYFHIGGDENTGKDWQSSPHIRAFMTSHRMKSYMDVQTWFNRRLTPIFQQMGKTMVGWDEILQPGLPAQAVIQSWRGSDSFYAAVHEGHPAILSYGYYIDLIQPASYHYLNDPLPDSVRLSQAERRLVLGGEATMWGELVNPTTMDSRIWPRTAAIAERLWSPASVRDVDDMYRRLDDVSRELEALGLRHKSYREPLLRQLSGGDDIQPLQTLVDVLEPLKIYDRNEGDTMYTVFSPLTKLADVAAPDQPLPRAFTKQVDEFLQGGNAAVIKRQLTIWRDNDTAFRRILRGSPVLEEAASLSAHLASLASVGLEAVSCIEAGGKMDTGEAMQVVRLARQQGGRCELQVVEPVARLIARAAGEPGSAAGEPGATAFTDAAFLQAFSVQYPLDSTDFWKVRCDRNGVIKVLSSEGLLTPSGGQPLYPGKLVRDLSYRPLADKDIKDMELTDGQFVYLDDQAVRSNAWAGAYPVPHGITGARLFCSGSQATLLVAGEHDIRYFDGGKLVYEWKVTEAPIALRYEPGRRRFWLLDRHALWEFNPADRSATRKFTGDGFTCFTFTDDGVVIGTHEGYWQGGVIHDKLPCTDLTTVEAIDGRLWFGSVKGAFCLKADGRFDYYSSRRWLCDDSIADIATGPGNSILLLSRTGLSVLHFDDMTLEQKASYYERQVRQRHIRYGFNASLSGIRGGDPATGSLEDSDNDGLWTSMYLAAEGFRYAATRSTEALENCRESLNAMERLFTINGLQGFPSRSFERHGYEVSDHRAASSPWRTAPDTAWDWKSTTSSDEAIGHIFAYAVLAELVDDTEIKQKAIHLMDALMQHIVDHDFCLVDWNGQPTTWGHWNPEYVNAHAKVVGDRKLESSNIVSMLQTAYHFTGKPIYKEKALELLYRYGYLENTLRPCAEIGPAPADASALDRMVSDHWNHSDDEMYFLGYWGLYRYALNDSLRAAFRGAILDHWKMERPEKEGLWDIMAGRDIDSAAWYLQRYPLDLRDWKVVNSGRRDLEFLPPNFREQTTREVLPPDELPVSRHNENRFRLDGGGKGELEYSAGDIWLLPYWMERWLSQNNNP
ncbi:beta-N-acetylhexosaminidase [Dinghuibacter silviterrae]|uniref:beta-N-acetylhexosaminidase n=1 Tax=Dinghuibacter silviterrae TaxID=1539049 RepID=UPI0013C37548|nr:family 20 glycosylhydrolase [Dinghuibacter silviterrae]